MRDLLSELRRRKVFRAAGAYAVAAFVALQVVALAVEPLRLPDWTMTLLWVLALAGFPVAVALAWAFDLAPDDSRADAPDESPAAEPAATDGGSRATGEETAAGAGPFGIAAGRRRLGVGLALVALLGAAAIGSLVLQRSPEPVTPAGHAARTAVAVLPFSVEGHGDLDYLATGMVKLLGAKLDGLAGLRSVDANVLLTYVEDDPGTVGPEAARAVAGHFGAGLYILGSVIEAGGRVRLDAALYDRESDGDPAVRASAEGAVGDVLGLVDELAAKLLAGRLEDTGMQLARSAALTTRSLAALEAYLDGERHYRAGHHAQAVAAFQRAAVEDTTFALAWYRLANAAGWGNQFAHFRRTALPAALRHAEGLSPLDRGLVEAYAAYTRGDWNAAEAAYRRLGAQYPESAEAWRGLGETLYHGNAFRGRPRAEAWDVFRRGMALDPGNISIADHLADMALAAGRFALADSLLGKGFSQVGGDSTIPWSSGTLAALAVGDPAGQRRMLDSLGELPERPTRWVVRQLLHEVPVSGALMDSIVTRVVSLDSTGWGRIRAMLALERGRWSEDEAKHAREDRGPAFLLRAWYAASPAFRVPEEDVRRLRRTVQAWTPASRPEDAWPSADDPYAGVELEIREYLLGLLALRSGDGSAAASAAAALERAAAPGRPHAPLARRLTNELGARLAWSRGDAAGALRILEETDRQPFGSEEYLFGDPFYGLTHARWLRAELLAEVGRDQEALEWYETFIGQVNYSSHLYRPLAHLRRAGILERRADPEGAKADYARFLDLWEGSDPHLRPLLDDARARQARLSGERT